MSAYLSKFYLNTFKHTPYFKAQLPAGYPVDEVLVRSRAFRRLPPTLRRLAGLAKRWAQNRDGGPHGMTGIERYYDDDGYELDPDSGRRLSLQQIDAQWKPPDPALAHVPILDVPEPPGGFPDPDAWEPPPPEPDTTDDEPGPSHATLVRDIRSRGRAAVSETYGIPEDELPPGVEQDPPPPEPRVGEVDTDGLVILGIATGELYDGPPLPAANAFCATGPGGGIDPTCSPKDILHTARAAAGRNDQATLAHVNDLVRKAGSGRARRGELGLAGLKELAKGVGLKGHSKLSKAGLSRALQDHFGKAAGAAPHAELADRLDRLALAEKYTGIKHEDRVVNGVIAGTSVGRSADYRTALADVARNGTNARKEHLSYLKAVRGNVRKELATGAHDTLLKHVLEGIADNGHGSLSLDEFKARLAGGDKAVLKGAAGAAGGGRTKDPGIIPDDLTLKPARKGRGKAAKAKAPEPDYIDRLRAPLADRLKDVKDMEEASKVPFAVRVIHALIADPKTRIQGSDEYLKRADREAAGERLTAEERRAQSGFRAKAVAEIKLGDITPPQLVKALEAVDGERRGTLRWDEFVDTLKKVRTTRNAVLGGFGKPSPLIDQLPAPPGWYQDLITNSDPEDPDDGDPEP